VQKVFSFLFFVPISFLRSAWERNCASSDYHAELGSQMMQSVESDFSFLRSAWECNCASRDYHAELGSQMMQSVESDETTLRHARASLLRMNGVFGYKHRSH